MENNMGRLDLGRTCHVSLSGVYTQYGVRQLAGCEAQTDMKHSSELCTCMMPAFDGSI